MPEKDKDLSTFKSGTRRFDPPPKRTLTQALDRLDDLIHNPTKSRRFKRYRNRGFTPEELETTKRIVGERDED